MLKNAALRTGVAVCAAFVFADAQAQSGGSRGLAYIVNDSAPGTVSVIDNSTASLVATIPVGNNPTRVIASLDGSEVFVSNSGSGTVSVISTATTGGVLNQTVQATIPVGKEPQYMAVTPDGQQLYVTNRGSNTVSVINIPTNTVVATISLPRNAPWSVAAAPDGDHVYVGYTGANLVSVIDTATLTDVADINIKSGSRYITVSPDSTHVYVSQTNLGAVGVIDTSANTLLASVATGGGETNVVAVTPDGSEVFSANPGIGHGAATIASFDAATNLPTAIINVGPLCWQVVLSSDGSTAYTASSSTDLLYVIDVASKKITAEVPVGAGPYWTTLSNPEGAAYVTNSPAGTVTVVDTITNKPIATIATGANPWTGTFVNAPVIAAVITSVSPGTVAQGTSISATVNGSGFEPGASLKISSLPAGVALSSLQYVGANQLTVTISATSIARTGPRDLMLTNPDGTTASLTKAIVVQP